MLFQIFMQNTREKKCFYTEAWWVMTLLKIRKEDKNSVQCSTSGKYEPNSPVSVTFFIRCFHLNDLLFNLVGVSYYANKKELYKKNQPNVTVTLPHYQPLVPRFARSVAALLPTDVTHRGHSACDGQEVCSKTLQDFLPNQHFLHKLSFSKKSIMHDHKQLAQ